MHTIKSEIKNMTKYVSFYEMLPFGIIAYIIASVIFTLKFITIASMFDKTIIAISYVCILAVCVITPIILNHKSIKYIGAFENEYERTLLGFSALTEKGITRKINKAKKYGWYYDGFGGLSPLRQVDAFPDYLDTIW